MLVPSFVHGRGIPCGCPIGVKLRRGKEKVKAGRKRSDKKFLL
jgi:hypothetical protein